MLTVIVTSTSFFDFSFLKLEFLVLRIIYYLAKLNVPVILQKEVIREGYDVVLLKALFAVDDMCLPLAPKMELKRVADDKLQFHMYDDIDGFPEWKASQLNKLPA